MELEEIEMVINDSFRKLLNISKPPIRYFLLTDVAGRKMDDPMVRRTMAECAAYPPKLRLLESMNPDGTWAIPKQRRIAEEAGPGPPVGWTYITMLRNLYTLSEYVAKRDEGFIENSLEKILSWQAEDGHIPGPWSDVFPLPHYNGFAVRAMNCYGMEKDPRVQRIVQWLYSKQREDGGWLAQTLDDVRYLPKYKYMRMSDFTDRIRRGEIEYGDPGQYAQVPSCTWCTLLVLRGLILDSRLAVLPETQRAASLVLDRFFTKNPIASFQRSEQYWTKLRYPTHQGSGLLALDILTWIGFGAQDRRMEKPIAWLVSARGKDGMWAQSDRPQPERDQWITEIALSILQRYAKSMRGEPFGVHTGEYALKAGLERSMRQK